MTPFESQSLSWVLPPPEAGTPLVANPGVSGRAISPGAGPTGDCPLSSRQDNPCSLQCYAQLRLLPNWSHRELLPLGPGVLRRACGDRFPCLPLSDRGPQFPSLSAFLHSVLITEWVMCLQGGKLLWVSSVTVFGSHLTAKDSHLFFENC